MASIDMKNIVKKYGDGFPAVTDVSMDIADGEFMILVGPSGCGKSTLLRMIVGLEDITSGDMEIGGKRVNDKAPRDRNLSMVFQNYALYPHLSVFENIAFPLRLAKAPEDEVKKTRSQARAELVELFERGDSVAQKLATNAATGLPPGFEADAAVLRARATKAELDALAAKYFDPSAGIVIVVGPRAKIEPQLKDLSLPAPELRDEEGAAKPK